MLFRSDVVALLVGVALRLPDSEGMRRSGDRLEPMPGCRLRDAPAQPRQPLPRLGDSAADAGPDLDLCAQELRHEGADLRLDRRRAILEDLRRRIVGKVARPAEIGRASWRDRGGQYG